MAVMNVMVGVSTNNSNKIRQAKIKKEQPVIPQKVVRVSKRNLRTKRNAGVSDNRDIKSVSRTVELAKLPIDYGDPKQKLLFLTGLGLTPKSTGKIMPPFVKLQRLDGPKPTYNPSNIKCPVPRLGVYPPESLEPSRLTEYDETEDDIHCDYTDSDVEDLDLELLIYPIDIPEFFEEIFNKKSSTSTSTASDNNSNKKGQSQSNNNDQLVQNSNKRARSICTYLPQQKNYYNSRSDIPFIDLTQDDDIPCQGQFTLKL